MSDYVLNDFGFRGVSSVESAKIGGAAHLVNFSGSDNVIASKMLVECYNAKRVYGKSIPATEHSIMTLKGEEGELEMMKRVLELNPNRMVACVSDSFDILRACAKYWGTDLRDMILSRPANAPIVIRPDSGHVLNTLRHVFDILFSKFGYTTNEKGYKVLPPQVRVIQGDGVNLDSIKDIYNALDRLKISPENLALGMGGKLLQAGIDRDTNNFAIKACFAILDGIGRDIVKNPKELDEVGNYDSSFKKSKKGIPKLVLTSNGYVTLTPEHKDYENSVDCLQEVFNTGKLLVDENIVDIKDRAKTKLFITELIK